jgi:hypothetical protein
MVSVVPSAGTCVAVLVMRHPALAEMTDAAAGVHPSAAVAVMTAVISPGSDAVGEETPVAVETSWHYRPLPDAMRGTLGGGPPWGPPP